jgi:hypothetical protein
VPDMPTVVLVHGSWHGSWCWSLMAERLEAEGVAWATVKPPSVSGAEDL